MTEAEKKFIEGVISSSYKVVETRLDSIDNGIKTINDIVAKHEDRIHGIEVDKAGRTVHLGEFEKNRAVTCPTLTQVKALDDNLLEYKLAKRYPKTFIITSSVFGAVLILLTLAELGIILK